MFIELHTVNGDGEREPTLVNINQITVIMPEEDSDEDYNAVIFHVGGADEEGRIEVVETYDDIKLQILALQDSQRFRSPYDGV